MMQTYQLIEKTTGYKLTPPVVILLVSALMGFFFFFITDKMCKTFITEVPLMK